MKVITHMTQIHKCKDKEADQMLERYLLDRTDPFNPYKRLDYYEDDIFNVEDCLKKLKEKQSSFIKINKQNIISMNKTKAKNENYNNNFNSDNYNKSKVQNNNKGRGKGKGHNQTQNVEYVTEEYEENGITIIRQVQKTSTENKQSFKENNTQVTNKAQVPTKPVLKITDYTSYFSQYYSELKKYIINKIKNEKISEAEVIIPIIVGYQLVVIISKLENNEMAELKFITNFGFGFSMVEEILHCFSNNPKYSLFKTLDSLPLSKLLVLYKYLNICYLKASGAFYKKDEDQIEEDVYDEFIPREKKKVEKVESGLLYSLNRPKSNNYNIVKGKKNKPKIINPDDNRPTQKFPMSFEAAAELITKKTEEKEVKEIKENKLNKLFNDKDDYFDQEAIENSNKSKSKLGQLLNAKTKEEVVVLTQIKPKNKKFNGLNDDEFPSLS